MPTLASYRLHFLAPVHLGQLGMDEEEVFDFCPSDTLFAALVDTAADLYGPDGTRELLQAFIAGDPPWLISSAFPFVGAVAFYPRPMLPLAREEETTGQRKLLKRLRYLSEGAMRRLIEGKSLASALTKEESWLDNGALVLPEEAPLLPRARDGAAWKSEERPHVTLDRCSQASALYHVGQTRFAPEAGLQFLVLSRDENQRDTLEALLTHLGDRGLGGERSRGLGAFSWQHGPDVNWPDPGGLCLTLSRYHPSGAELRQGVLTGEGVSYRLETVGGWMAARGGAAQRRRKITFLVEGSVFRAPDRLPCGDVVDVAPTYDNPLGRPPHPVFRYGYALAIGIGEAA